MEYVKSLKWHCHHCGANVNPRDKHCSYCGSPTKHRAILGNDYIRVFAETKDRKIFLSEVTNIGSLDTHNEIIDCRTIDGTVSHIRGMQTGIWDLEMYCADRSMEKANYLTDGNKVDISIESDFGNFKIGCDYASVGEIKYQPNCLMTTEMHFVINDFDKLSKDTIWVNDGCTCPNCGAKLRQRFGLCDYCGGWSQYIDAYV